MKEPDASGDWISLTQIGHKGPIGWANRCTGETRYKPGYPDAPTRDCPAEFAPGADGFLAWLRSKMQKSPRPSRS